VIGISSSTSEKLMSAPTCDCGCCGSEEEPAEREADDDDSEVRSSFLPDRDLGAGGAACDLMKAPSEMFVGAP